MSLTEQTRVRLHQYFEDQMGRDVATEVMEWIPKGELATKDDIHALRIDMTREFEAVRRDFEHLATTLSLRIENTAEKLRSEFHRDSRHHTIVMVGAIVTLNAVMASAARIF